MSARSSVHSFHGTSGSYRGWIVVGIIHLIIGYLLASGMAQKGLHLIKKPLEAVVIQEVVIPPPPPPPKKIEKPQDVPKAPPLPYVPPAEINPPPQAPSIVSTLTPPKEPVVIAPAAPAAPKSLTGRQDIGVVCPTQVAPEMPRRAIRDGIEGVVKAQVTIVNGEIKEVVILSGNRIFHAAVKEAMMQYKCKSIASEVTATQEFSFKIE
jgi:protein TonB